MTVDAVMRLCWLLGRAPRDRRVNMDSPEVVVSQDHRQCIQAMMPVY